ncbi:MAG: tetratricopeptide repeat protein [Opitutales bacterium]
MLRSDPMDKDPKPTPQQRPTWLVCTGALRDIIDFRNALAHFIALRAEGTVRSIILSTWRGEVDRHTGLRDKLKEIGITVIEAEEPWDPGPNNFWRQKLALFNGLRAVPAGALVLKARTDKNEPNVALMAGHTREPVAEAEAFGEARPVFRHRLRVVLSYSTFPGHIQDMAFLGTRETVASLSHFGAHNVTASRCLALDPGYSWLRDLFARRYPLFDTLYEWVNIKDFSRAVIHYLKAGDGRSMPHLVAQVLALHAVTAWQHLAFAGEDPFEETPTFHEWLLGKKGCSRIFRSQSAEWVNGPVFRSARALDLAVHGRLEGGGGDYEVFLDFVDQLRRTGRLDAEWGLAEHHELAGFLKRWIGRWDRALTPRGVLFPKAKLAWDPALVDGWIESLRDFSDLIGDDVSDQERKYIQRLFTKVGIGQRKIVPLFYKIGMQYLEGDGLPRNDARAALWLRRAAERKHVDASYQIGSLLRKGRGIPRNPKEAARFLLFAAKLNHPEAATEMADIFFRGEGTNPSPARCRHYIKRARTLGSATVGSFADRPDVQAFLNGQ